MVNKVNKISEATEGKHCVKKMSKALAIRWNRDVEYIFGFLFILKSHHETTKSF